MAEIISFSRSRKPTPIRRAYIQKYEKRVEFMTGLLDRALRIAGAWPDDEVVCANKERLLDNLKLYIDRQLLNGPPLDYAVKVQNRLKTLDNLLLERAKVQSVRYG